MERIVRIKDVDDLELVRCQCRKANDCPQCHGTGDYVVIRTRYFERVIRTGQKVVK